MQESLSRDASLNYYVRWTILFHLTKIFNNIINLEYPQIHNRGQFLSFIFYLCLSLPQLDFQDVCPLNRQNLKTCLFIT